MNKILVFFVLGIILANGAYALGISPARTTVDFSPGMEKTVQFTVVNSEHKEMELILYTQGEL